MAFDVNEVTVLGRLGADPEIKSFQNGGQICNLRVATSESWKDRQTGERQERVEWHSVTLRTDYMINYAKDNLKKGSRVYVRGKLQTRKWQDQNGNDRYSTEVVVAGYDGKLLGLDPRQSSNGQGSQKQQSNQSSQSDSGWNTERNPNTGSGYGAESSGSGSNYDDLDDDIPF